MERIVMERIIFLPIVAVAVIALLLSGWLPDLIRSSFLDAIGVACNSASTPNSIKFLVCWLG